MDAFNQKGVMLILFTLGLNLVFCCNVFAKEKEVVYLFYTLGDSSITVRHDNKYSFFSLQDKNNYTFVYKSQDQEKIVFTSRIDSINNLFVDVKKLVNLNLKELDLIFSTDCSVKIIERRSSLNGEQFAIYPVEFFSPQNAYDSEEFQAEILSSTVPNTTKFRIGRYNYWIVDSQLVDSSECEDRFTPSMNDIGSFVRYINEREISWNDSLINFYCHGCLSDGKRYLNIIRLDSLDIYNCFHLKKKGTPIKKRNILKFSIDDLYLENGPFLYSEHRDGDKIFTDAVYNSKEYSYKERKMNTIRRDSLMNEIKKIFEKELANKRVVLWAKGITLNLKFSINCKNEITYVSFRWNAKKDLFNDKELTVLYTQLIRIRFKREPEEHKDLPRNLDMQLSPTIWFI